MDGEVGFRLSAVCWCVCMEICRRLGAVRNALRGRSLSISRSFKFVLEARDCGAVSLEVIMLYAHGSRRTQRV